jgi:aminopeptidase
MEKLEYGAYQAVYNCVKVQPKEKVVIITDIDRKFIADKIYKFCEEITPGNTVLFIMEDFGERPEDGVNPLEFPEEIIGKTMSKADVSFYCAGAKKGELPSFRVPMCKHVDSNAKLRHAHMPGISTLLMETGMNVDYNKVQELSAKIYNIVDNAEKIKVTTPAGTDFTASFNTSWKWIISDGNIQADSWSNLPDGEVFTCVKDISEGKIVIDGVLGDFFCEKYGLLDENPLTVEIKNGRVVSAKCKNKELLEEFNNHLKIDKNGNRIGEFAIGTNTGLSDFVGNLLQDEKFPGIHVAFGHGYPEKSGSDWNSDVHVDAVLRNCTIEVDSKPIMIDGKFVI